MERSIDVSVEAIRTQLDRILASPGFVHSDRMVRFLRFTVEQALKGHASELKETILGMEVFDRPSSFDPRTDTIVRVEARRLRSKLKEYYEGEGRGDAVRIDFPKGSYVPTFVLVDGRGEAPKTITSSERDLLSNKPTSRPPLGVASLSQSHFGTVIATGLLLVAVSVGITLWLTRSSPPSQPLKLTRLTSDLGLTHQPTLSSDVKLVAYASDRSGEGNLDIWMKQVAGGEPTRLTRHVADDHEPVFSPDGSKIAFRSERDGGGIYLISPIGGDERLIAPQGRRPQFSPDGTQIAYLVDVKATNLNSKIYLVASSGGPPRQLQPEFAYAFWPAWSPDGKHVVFLGVRDERLFLTSRGIMDSTQKPWDWWVAPVQGGSAVPTGALGILGRQGLKGPRRYLTPEKWVATEHGDAIIFSAGLGDSINIWQVGIASKTWQISNAAQRLTFGAGEVDPSLAGPGRLVFASFSAKSDIWSLPIDANQGKVLGEPELLTQNATDNVNPSLSADGKKLAFNSTRSGHPDIWIRDMETGQERALTDDPQRQTRVLISPDGSKVVYTLFADGKTQLYEAAATGGSPRRLCDNCDAVPLGWSPNGFEIVYWYGQPIRFGLLNVESGERHPILQHPEYNLHRAQISPDERWIAFYVPTNRYRVFIAPLRRGATPGENEWIKVTDGSDRHPFWSPDGSLLYFVSEGDGFSCIRAQPLDPATKRPFGSSIDVYHIHNARRSLSNSAEGRWGMSLTRDKLVFSMAEITGNIWMAEPER